MNAGREPGHAAAGEGPVVADAPVVPVDLGGGGEARAGAAVGVRAEPVDLELQRDRLGRAADREVAVGQEVAAVRPHAGGGEGHGPVRLNLKKVRAVDVVVAVRLAGVHRAQVYSGGEGGVQRVRGGDDGALELVETATDLAHHHVPDDERHLGVHRVNSPRPGDVAGNLHGCLGHHSSREKRFSDVRDFTRVR